MVVANKVKTLLILHMEQ